MSGSRSKRGEPVAPRARPSRERGGETIVHVVDANKPRPLRAERTIRRRPGGSLISGAVIIAIVLLGALPAGAADLQRLIERADVVTSMEAIKFRPSLGGREGVEF